MKTNPCKKNKAAFTLVELLVVIMIVVTLASLGIMTTRSALRKADLTKTKQICADLVMAIENFAHDHHGIYPISVEDYPEGDGDLQIKTDEFNNLMMILTNREKGIDKVNQAGKVYFSAQSSPARSSGLYESPSGTLGLYDPWRNPYFIVLDINGDDKVKDPTVPGGQEVYKKVIIFSPGEDAQYGTVDKNKDNVYSFKGQ